ncbi:MAG: acetamidase/formamidase family protein [Chloroflexota bacterium]
MKYIDRANSTSRFAADVATVLTVEPGETIVMDSHDTTRGRVRREEDVFTYVQTRDRRMVNPAAGPVFVTGAEPGDTLAVEILDIQLDDAGSLRIMPGTMGVLNEEMASPYCRIVRIEHGRAVFSPTLSWPVRPMVGVVATTPADGEILTADPGDVGSNMDHNDVAVGTTVYLPVKVPGALFGVGDLHATMGDGEITGNGIEIGGKTTVKVGLIKGRQWAHPWMETAEDWITTGYGEPLEAAIKMAVRDMVEMLVERLGVNKEDAYMLVSARGDVRLGQACGGMAGTARVRFPKLNG